MSSDPRSEADLIDNNEFYDTAVEVAPKKSKKNKKVTASEETTVVADGKSAQTSAIAVAQLKSKNTQKYRAPSEGVPIAAMPDSAWDEKGSIQLHSLLCKALEELKFLTPTPIQYASIPLSLKITHDVNNNDKYCDIVGAAETGSGKTLVFINIYPNFYQFK